MPHTIRIPMCHHRPSQYRFIYMEFMLLSVFVFKYGIFILYWSMKIIKYHFGTFLFFLSPLFFCRSLKCHTKYARDSIKNSNEVPYSLLDVKDTLIRYRSERGEVHTISTIYNFQSRDYDQFMISQRMASFSHIVSCVFILSRSRFLMLN